MGVSPQSSQFTSPQSATKSSTKTTTKTTTGTVPKNNRRRNPDLPDIGVGRQNVTLQRIN
jgi:hypothetical protein